MKFSTFIVGLHTAYGYKLCYLVVCGAKHSPCRSALEGPFGQFRNFQRKSRKNGAWRARRAVSPLPTQKSNVSFFWALWRQKYHSEGSWQTCPHSKSCGVRKNFGLPLHNKFEKEFWFLLAIQTLNKPLSSSTCRWNFPRCLQDFSVRIPKKQFRLSSAGQDDNVYAHVTILFKLIKQGKRPNFVSPGWVERQTSHPDNGLRCT